MRRVVVSVMGLLAGMAAAVVQAAECWLRPVYAAPTLTPLIIGEVLCAEEQQAAAGIPSDRPRQAASGYG